MEVCYYAYLLHFAIFNKMPNLGLFNRYSRLVYLCVPGEPGYPSSIEYETVTYGKGRWGLALCLDRGGTLGRGRESTARLGRRGRARTRTDARG